MKIFAGNGCPLLAERISQKLNIPISKMNLTQFQDGEINVEILEHVRGEDVFIIQSTCRPANDNLMELATIADALRRSDAQRVVAVMPYYGYARQDRRQDMRRTPITSRLIADLLQTSGVTYVMTVDIHSDQQQGFFNIPFVNISASTVLINHIKEKHGTDIVTVSPDLGGVKRARSISNAIGNGNELAIIDKRRPKPNVSEVMNVIGNVENRTCVMIDDIVDTAGTLIKAATALKNKGAKSVHAYASHPVLSGNAITDIINSELDTLIVTDTIPLRKPAGELYALGRLMVSSVSNIVAATMNRINKNLSISDMFFE